VGGHEVANLLFLLGRYELYRDWIETVWVFFPVARCGLHTPQYHFKRFNIMALYQIMMYGLC